MKAYRMRAGPIRASNRRPRTQRPVSTSNQTAPSRTNETKTSGGSNVLGKAGEYVMLEADAIDGRLDGAVEKFDDQDEEHWCDEQRPLDARAPQP